MPAMSLIRGKALAAVLLMFSAIAPAAQISPQQWLKEQVRVGEASHNNALVQQSLYRLELMSPDDPEVIAARLRLALRQGDQTMARQQLAKLQRLAPDSPVTRQAQTAINLTTPEFQRQLQQARLLAAAGRLPEAKGLYDHLFNELPPTLDLAIEYWLLVARLPGQQTEAIKQLQLLDQRYPGNEALRQRLVTLLFAENRDAEGYAVLTQLAGDEDSRDDAAQSWMNRIKTMPVGAASVAALHRYLDVFDTEPQRAAADQELARQLALLADPRYQARLTGLAMVGQGKAKSAIAPLQQALKLAPDDAEVLGALGLAYARAGQRQQAIDLFEQAQKADQNGFHGNKWRSLIDSNRYWLLIDQGDRALQAHHLPLAQQLYLQAQHIDSQDSQSWVGLGQIAVARTDDVRAEQAFLQALRLEPDNGSAIRGLAAIYERQSPRKALDFLTHLNRRQRAGMQPGINRLQGDIYSDRAEQFAARQQWPQAAENYRLAQQLAPDQVWLTYHLAQALRSAGQPGQADAVFHPLLERQAGNPELVYAYALYLSSSDRPDQARACLVTLPVVKWSRDMRDLYVGLQLQAKQDQASRLRERGHEPAAIALLSQPPIDNSSRMMLADWALARGDNAAALQGYRQVLQQEPANPDARLGEIDALIGQGRFAEARQRLIAATQARADKQSDSVHAQRRIADFWNAVGEPARALQLLQTLKPAALKQGDSQDDALVFRDSARLERQLSQPQAARQDDRQAMVASGMTPVLPQNDIDDTRLTRNRQEDDWLKSSIRSDTADLARAQDIRITLDHDYASYDGTGGVSDLTSHDTMLQADLPVWGGRAFLRADSVQMDAGHFSTTNGAYDTIFGTCASVGCRGGEGQSTSGTSLAAGWQNDHWQGDLGTTPLGFAVVDWVGGLSYSNDWQKVGWTLTASRRPISNSLLAFGGTRDPATGMTWGGVRATGVTLAGSYDQGEANGVWSNLGFQQLTGENVADNERLRLMGGYYYKLINENNRRATVGLTSMWWHYQKDLSDYALGQGGYYSPQRYVSFSVPLNYRQRTENWSWLVGGSLGWSEAKTDDHPRYPLPGLIPDIDADKYTIDQGGSSSGVGYTLLALVERRLDSHWTLGAGFDIQQSKDYAPSHALMYLRYSLAGWQGDLDLPPLPLTPYADFR
jgi:Flp pilus assembly protein TadD